MRSATLKAGVVLAVAGLALTGCGSGRAFGHLSATPATHPTPTTTAGGGRSGPSGPSGDGGTSQPTASSMTLTVSDLPTGWSQDDSYHEGYDDGGAGSLSIDGDDGSDACGLDTIAGQPTTSYAYKEFEGSSSGVPDLDEDVSVYSGQFPAISDYNTVLTAMNSCRSYVDNDTEDEDVLKGTLTPMTLPPYGDRSAAWKLTVLDADSPDVTLTGAMVAVYKGDVLVQFTYLDTSPDEAVLESVIRAAMIKVG